MTPSSVQYRITRVVGEGAFGRVYEAERVSEGLSRRVAMKLLHASQAARPGIEARLRDEARMLSLIQHRAIVRVDDLRLVHRDIKPANVRLTPQGDVKLLDFGIARAEFGAREFATRVGGMGTIVYMSAERLRGEDTHAGDVYALGVTLFELLVGAPPGASAADVDRRPPGRALRAQWAWLGQLDPDLLALVAAMLADEPDHRPTARECARTLALLRARVAGPLLEDWAEEALASPTPDPIAVPPPGAAPPTVAPSVPRRDPSLLPGGNATMLTVGQTIGRSAEAPRMAPSRSWAVVGAVIAFAGGLAALFAAGAAWWSWQSWRAPPEPVALPSAPARSDAPVAPFQPATSGSAPTPARAPRARSPSRESVPAPDPVDRIRGTLVATGAERVTLDGPAGAAGPGLVPAGTYAATVYFAGGARVTVAGVRVEAGRTTRLRCDEGFATCAVSAPE